MKLFKNLTIGASIIITLSACSNYKSSSLSMMIPTGTPLFGLSTYLDRNEKIGLEVVEGGDALTAAFAKKEKDIIVAPINVGANMYSKNKSYKLFETIVWGNLYVASRYEITSFSDIANKKIAVFGTNQTPDIIMNTLCSTYNISFEKQLTDSVNSSASMFLQGQVDYFVAAEPSLSKLKLKNTIYTLDLQEEWKKITSSSSYPQAGVFVREDRVNSLKGELTELKKCVKNLLKDPSHTVSCALKQESLATLGEETLKNALPNCHFGIDENQKSAIEFYFNKLTELNLEKTFGGVLPSEDFYISL